MAKTRSAPQVSNELLAECLRKGLAGEACKLQGGGANPGLFPAGAKGLSLINTAREKGLIEDAVPSASPGGKPARGQASFARLTERGRQFVVDFDDPKKLLESLKAVLAEKGQLVADSLQSVSGSVNQWQKDLLQQQHHFQNALQNVSKMLTQMKEPSTHAVPPSSSQPPPPAVLQPEQNEVWIPEIIELIRKHKAANSYSRPTLTQIYQDLIKRHPRLTIGQFHDGLRKLSKERRIVLTAYTLALATLEDPQSALYLDREVKYYVDLP